jgi:NADH:ubiquinone oxidoreductase subunit 5 (subunit L)/multisubunit Na+/H+ antiporter MnhA subunit
MPATSLFFLAGSVAICGLPPFNGFVSEYLLYIGFFADAKTAPIPYLSLGAPLLAIVGGLAMVCFVKLYGTTFLGVRRTTALEPAHESSRFILAPMGLLALLCLCAGVFPQSMVDILQPVLGIWATDYASAGGTAALSSLQWLTYTGFALTLAVGGLAALLRQRLKATQVAGGDTWGCGYLKPAVSMQYTASSFGEMAVHLFRGIIRPRFGKPHVEAIFPHPAGFASAFPETLLEQIVFPCFRVMGDVCSFLRIVQMGKTHIYMLYMFIVLVLLLIWAY